MRVWQRKIYRKLRLISADRFNKPIKKNSIILEFFQGMVSLLIGMVLVCNLSVRLSLCNNRSIEDKNQEIVIPVNDKIDLHHQFKNRIDQVVEPLVHKSKHVGISVGIIKLGQTAIFGYGRTSIGGTRLPDGNTIYEIGSVTKVFTSLLLADLVQAGLVETSDPVGKLLPSSVKAPSYDGTEITLISLSSHTSGLPRIPSNLFRLNDFISLNFIKNPYANYTSSKLNAFLSEHKLKAKPGARYSYSNLGMGLLGHILAQSRDTTFEELIVRRICHPLGMKDTRIILSDEQKTRLAEGCGGTYSFGPLCLKFPARNWDFLALAGCG
ncbi:MAG TPA: serine hydrolase domain-containing protein, partial [Desulfosporosinus sp.]|nr:serine hydrolase domain-containing protein [Desulfosporosinus sp.]